jgi:hypothetical protein
VAAEAAAEAAAEEEEDAEAGHLALASTTGARFLLTIAQWA